MISIDPNLVFGAIVASFLIYYFYQIHEDTFL